MPTIPDVDNLQRVAPQPSRGAASYRAGAPEEALSQVGDIVQRGSAVALDHMNTVQAQNAVNQLRDRASQLTFGQPENPNDPTTGGYANVTGNAAMGANGQPPILDTYKQRFKTAADGIAATLSGGALEKFNTMAGQLGVEFNTGLLQHVMRQSDIAADDTMKDTIGHALATAAADPTNPIAINSAVQSIDGMMPAYAARRGTAAADLLRMKSLSALHGNVTEQLLTQGRTGDAKKYFDMNSASITDPDVLARLHQQFHLQDVRQQGADAAAAGEAYLRTPAPSAPATAPSAPPFSNTMLGSVLLANRQVESGNNPNAKNPNSSAAGATQVVNATSTDPGFGVVPVRDNSIGERDRVGDDYMAAMVRHYKGDLVKAFAAYQGPGMVDGLVKQYGDDWFSHLPADMQTTVQKKLALVPGAAAPGGASQPTVTYQPMKSFQDVLDVAMAHLKSANPNPTPDVVEAVKTQTQQAYNAYLQQRTTDRDNAVGQAQQILAQNGGNWDALPPSVQQSLLVHAPEQIPALKAYAANSNPLSNPTTRTDAFIKAVQNPGVLAGMTPTQFETFKITNFSREDQPKVEALRNAAIAQTQNKPLPNGPQDIDAGVLTTAVDNRLYSIGMLQHGKSRPPQADMVLHYLTNQVYALQAQLGRKLQPAELQKFVDEQFARNVITRSTVLGMPFGSAQSTPIFGMQVKDIPADDHDTITSALQKRGVSAPTDEQILNEYWKHYRPLRASK